MTQKILLVANTAWYLYNFRIDLVEKLRESGFEPVLISPPSKYSEMFEELGFRHIPWKIGRKTINPIAELRSIYQLKQIYQNENPSLIHHHTNKAVIYGSIAAKQLETPIVNSIPGLGYVFSSKTLLAIILRPVLFFLYKTFVGKLRQHSMVFENRENLDYFVRNKIIPKDRVVLIPSVGVNIKKFSSEPNLPEVFTVVFAGRFLVDKGAGIFAEASKILADRGLNYRMVMVGLPDYGNPNSFTEEQIRIWERDNSLTWWGWQDNMREVYQKVHALALPTFYGEGVPTSILEAGASERAVIATDWPGCREVITDKETGILIPPKDAEALADAIDYLATHPNEFNQMRKALQEKIWSQFDSNLVNSKTLAIYKQLLT